ncbi:MAG TPA: serine/threonine-protein kinase [Acidimicrobiales bacterium]
MTSATEILSGRYRLGRLLGRGGMSDVYLAVDQESGREVAVKIVRSGDPELARRLAQEARALEGFDHPGLVRLLDTGVTGDQAYLVMEFVAGSNLAEILRRGRLTPEITADLGASVAGALGYVHERGIVHRDVKPANILVTPDGQARLGDFGIARLIDVSTLTLDGTTLGTAAYMAPEQLENHQVGPSADIWSLGLVLLESLTGQQVYRGSPGEMVAQRLAGPVPIPADLPVPWKVLLSGMLQDRPDQRLGALEVADLLDTAALAAPWEPSAGPATDPLAATQADDLTQVSPLPGVGGTTQVAPGDTRVAPPALVVGTRLSRARRQRLAAVAVLLATALVVGLVLAFAPGGTPTSNSTTTTHPVTTTTSTPPTTAAGPPTAAQALASLVGDVASGVAAHTVSASVGQMISSQAQEAVTDAASGKTQPAANDLQQAAASIANGIRSAAIAASEGAVLQADLSTLASALDLGGAAAETTTVPHTTPPPTPTTAAGPGAGPGGGPKGKGDNGN